MARNRTYLGDHTCWSEIVDSYGIEGREAREPKFVFAEYRIDGHDGSSIVITSNTGRKFNVVEGSHCSCFGLEHQWMATTHGIRDMKKMLTSTCGFFHTRRDEIEKWMKHVEPK